MDGISIEEDESFNLNFNPRREDSFLNPKSDVQIEITRSLASRCIRENEMRLRAEEKLRLAEKELKKTRKELERLKQGADFATTVKNELAEMKEGLDQICQRVGTLELHAKDEAK